MFELLFFVVDAKESISYQRVFRFGQENEIFRYQLIRVYRFKVIANICKTSNNIYIYVLDCLVIAPIKKIKKLKKNLILIFTHTITQAQRMSFRSILNQRTILTNLLAQMGCSPNFFNNNGILQVQMFQNLSKLFLLGQFPKI